MSNHSPQPPRHRGNFISRYVDPIRNAASMEGHVLMAETIAKLVAVIVTSVGFGVWGYDVAAQYTDWAAIQILAGLLFAGIAAWITDFAFSHFLENSLFQFFAFWKFDWIHTAVPRDGWYITFFLRPIRWVVVTLIVAGLFWADWASVTTLRSPIANAKKERVERVDFAALRSEQQRAIANTISPIDKEITQLRADIATAERNVVANNSALQKLVADGNSWAKGQMAAKKTAATKADKKRLATLQAQRDKAYSDITASTAQERQIALADDQSAQQSEAESKAAIATLFTMFGLGSKMLTIFFRLFLVINFLITSPNWDANGDGVVDGNDVAAAARTTPHKNSQAQHSASPSPAFAQRRRAGFVRHDEPPEHPQSRTDFALGAPSVPPTIPGRIAVEQCSTAEKPEQSSRNSSGNPTGTPTVPRSQKGVCADVKYWKMQAKQCLERSITQKREEFREHNRLRYEAYRSMLEALGVQVQPVGEGRLEFKEPPEYDTSDTAMRIVEAQYTILQNLKNRAA